MRKFGMTYDEAINRIETIINGLDHAGAIPFDEFRKKEQEANRLILFCEHQLRQFEDEASKDFTDVQQDFC